MKRGKCSIIRFGEVTKNGNVYPVGSIKIEDLERLEIQGTIKDFEIDEDGVTVIKEIELTGVSAMQSIIN